LGDEERQRVLQEVPQESPQEAMHRRLEVQMVVHQKITQVETHQAEPMYLHPMQKS
jgi:hypothetical protein